MTPTVWGSSRGTDDAERSETKLQNETETTPSPSLRVVKSYVVITSEYSENCKGGREEKKNRRVSVIVAAA